MSSSLFARPRDPNDDGRSSGGAFGNVNVRPLPDTNVEQAAACYKFRAPEKSIKSPADMHCWQTSNAYDLYLRFVVTLNNSVTGQSSATSTTSVSPCVEKIIELLDVLECWIDENPPVDQPQRFGNVAFRSWHAKLVASIDELVTTKLLATNGKQLEAAVCELSPYIVDAFGNATRIDYGTGHEASFCMFLACLYLIGLINRNDCAAVVNRVFSRYLTLVRRLQSTYNMEPAGSHGVWSLDDFQFLPFLFGSAQLVEHASIEPRHFVDASVVQQNEQNYMFMSSVAQILRVKTGPFAEHSNQLWNISGLPSWSKINSGLLKMYKGEVLNKFPVVQHFWFGSILPFEPAAKK